MVQNAETHNAEPRADAAEDHPGGRVCIRGRGRASLAAGLLLAVAPALPVAGQAGHVHTPGMHAAEPDRVVIREPVEVGQAAFAALQEVVSILEADPDTDWSAVDVEALRRHLVDMHEVTLRAEATTRDVPGGAVFTVDGPPRTREALHRMAPAHAMATSDDPRYRMQVGPGPGGAIEVTVTVKDPDDDEGVVRIRALGFIGLLVRGMHHGPHHLAIARGANPHAGHGGHGH